MKQFVHSFVATIFLIGTCSKTNAFNCTNRADGAPCGGSICNQGICLPESEGKCIDKTEDEYCGNCDTCLTYGNGRCFDVGNQGLLSCRNGKQYVEHWNKNQCASASVGDSCTIKQDISNYGETADGHSVFGEAPSTCGKVVDEQGGDQLVCLDPYESACSNKVEGAACTFNTFLGETKECGGSWFNGRDIPIDVLIGYNLCEKYGECYGDGTGASAKCIRGDDVHYKCELKQSGDCSAGSTLPSVSTLITTLCFMVPVLVALL